MATPSTHSCIPTYDGVSNLACRQTYSKDREGGGMEREREKGKERKGRNGEREGGRREKIRGSIQQDNTHQYLLSLQS